MEMHTSDLSFPANSASVTSCPHCSGQFNWVYHSGPCPRVKAIEYHPNGTVKRIEFREP